MAGVEAAVAGLKKQAEDYSTLVSAQIGFDEGVKQDDAVRTADVFATRKSEEVLEQASQARLVG